MSHDGGSSCKSYIKHPTEKERLDNLAFTSFPEDYLPYTSSYHRKAPYLVWDDGFRPHRKRRLKRWMESRACRCCTTAALTAAISLIIIGILAIVAVSIYLGVITNLFRSPVLSLSGKMIIVEGDQFTESLLNVTSHEFLAKAETYQAMLESVYLSSSLEPAFVAAKVYAFRKGNLTVFFRLYLDRRKLLQDDEATSIIARNIIVEQAVKNRPAFSALSLDLKSVEFKENTDEEHTPEMDFNFHEILDDESKSDEAAKDTLFTKIPFGIDITPSSEASNAAAPYLINMNPKIQSFSSKEETSHTSNRDAEKSPYPSQTTKLEETELLESPLNEDDAINYGQWHPIVPVVQPEIETSSTEEPRPAKEHRRISGSGSVHLVEEIFLPEIPTAVETGKEQSSRVDDTSKSQSKVPSSIMSSVSLVILPSSKNRTLSAANNNNKVIETALKFHPGHPSDDLKSSESSHSNSKQQSVNVSTSGARKDHATLRFIDDFSVNDNVNSDILPHTKSPDSTNNNNSQIINDKEAEFIPDVISTHFVESQSSAIPSPTHLPEPAPALSAPNSNLEQQPSVLLTPEPNTNHSPMTLPTRYPDQQTSEILLPTYYQDQQSSGMLLPIHDSPQQPFGTSNVPLDGFSTKHDIFTVTSVPSSTTGVSKKHLFPTSTVQPLVSVDESYVGIKESVAELSTQSSVTFIQVFTAAYGKANNDITASNATVPEVLAFNQSSDPETFIQNISLQQGDDKVSNYEYDDLNTEHDDTISTTTEIFLSGIKFFENDSDSSGFVDADEIMASVTKYDPNNVSLSSDEFHFTTDFSLILEEAETDSTNNYSQNSTTENSEIAYTSNATETTNIETTDVKMEPDLGSTVTPQRQPQMVTILTLNETYQKSSATSDVQSKAGAKIVPPFANTQYIPNDINSLDNIHKDDNNLDDENLFPVTFDNNSFPNFQPNVKPEKDTIKGHETPDDENVVIHHITTPLINSENESTAVSLGKYPTYFMNKCAEDEITCKSGECVPADYQCNMRRDCRDNSDEDECTCADKLKVIGQTQKICDGIQDCWDMSDEENCPWCTPGQFICTQSKLCIDMKQVCDGSNDCPYGTDERYCVKLSDDEIDVNSPEYQQSGFLMVQKEGQWGKLCLQNLHSLAQPENLKLKLGDLGQAVCSALSYKEMAETIETRDDVGEKQSYFEISTEATKKQNRQYNDIFLPSECPGKSVVHVTCKSLECGVRPMAFAIRRRIVGGDSTSSGSWPWQVALYKEGDFQCGAVLISDVWLISAGHCFYSSQNAHWTARLGVLRRGTELPSPSEQVRVITHIFIHPDYVDKGFINDIALLRIDSPVTFSDFLRPLCLPNVTEEVSMWHGHHCSVVGWGKLYEIGHTFPDSLQEVRLPVISTEECRKKILFLTMYHLTDNMFCAGYERGGRDACLGDSGGPLMCQRDDGRWVLLGVTSNGDGCGRPGRPGVYTKVTNYLEWIDDVMAGDLPAVKPSSCLGHRCNLGHCVLEPKVCDGRWDCSDGSDETNCFT